MTDAPDLAVAAASRRQSTLTLAAAIAAVVAGAAAASGWLMATSELATALGLVGSIAALQTLALGCTWLVDDARARLAQALAAKHVAATHIPTTPGPAVLATQSRDPDLLVSGELRRLATLATWGQALLALPFALLALACVVFLRPGEPSTNSGELGLGVTLIVLAFPLLIIERRLLSSAPAAFPEASALARLTRLSVWALVIGGAAAVGRALDFEVARYGQWLVGGLLAGVAGELALRAVMTPFLPVTRSSEARGLGDSVITALLLSRSRSGEFGSGLKERFGIDLAQSWAIRFLRRAALPLALVLATIAWLLSSLTTLGTGERGVLERFGVPAAVLQPGLHAHLPWPFAQVVRLDYGQIHELALGNERGELALPLIAADADTPADFDRLWERSHPADSSYLVPGPTIDGKGASHQLLVADVRVLWRVQLTDDAALKYVYKIVDPPALVLSRARHRLQETFASHPLSSFIGGERERFAEQLQTALQRDLDTLDSGIEVTALIVEAIHPPKEVVANYHGVQAAEIIARTDIARAKGQAASSRADAAREATDQLTQSQANASAALSQARAQRTIFSSDFAAFTAAPDAMRLERWLQTVGRTLNQANLTIIDHRLPIAGGTTIDLRKNFGNE